MLSGTPLWPCASIYDLHDKAGGSPIRILTAPNVHPSSKRGREVCKPIRKFRHPDDKMWVQKDTSRTKQGLDHSSSSDSYRESMIKL